MSHFTRVKTQLRNLNLVQQALEEMGHQVIPDSHVRGYHGDQTRADLVVHMPGKYDIGFLEQPDGDDEMVADFWGLKIDRKTFVNEVTQRYAYLTVVEQASAQGFQVTAEENQADGSIRLVMQRW